jgi:hypothetical protein
MSQYVPALDPPPSTRPPGRGGADAVLALLADGVPLSLLLDLAAAVPSHDLFRHEAGDTRWVPALPSSAA